MSDMVLAEEQELRRQRDIVKAQVAVVDDQSAYNADHLIQHFADKLKMFEQWEKPSVAAAHKAHQEALNTFRSRKDLCKEMIQFLKEQLGSYTLRRNAAMQAAIQQGAQNGSQAVAQVVDTEPLEFDNVSTKESWGFRVVDANLVPNELCVKTVNLRLVEIQVQQGVRNIPGIEIYPKADVRRKGKRDG